MSSISQEAIKNGAIRSYGKYAVFGTTGEGKKLVILKLEQVADKGRIVYYSFSNNPAKDAPDAGVLYPFVDSEWPISSQPVPTYEKYWETLGDDWGDQGVTGCISVEDAITQLHATTGRTYTIGG